MSLKDRINEDLKMAMKSGDKLRLETVRSIRAMIIEFEKSGANREINSDDEIKMLNSAVKKRKEAIEQFTNAGRIELASKEESELKILSEYLPQQLSEEDINKEVQKIAVQLGTSTKEDFSKLMPAVMKILKGKADGKIIRTIVEKYLGVS
jgi:hypothetical protein